MNHDPSLLLSDLEKRDETLWPEGNVSPTRLGWLDCPTGMRAHADDLKTWASGVTHSKIVLIGMGGSSLGPEVLRACKNNDRLIVLDTTDPATIESVPYEDSYFLVSSKSGSTLEIQTLFPYFWEKVPDGSRYAAITDPSTELEALAKEKGLDRIFTNPPDIGGRYSVLSLFGLVPAALMGYDIGELLSAATSVDRREAVDLGIRMAEASLAGQDKVTIQTSPQYESFGLWIEQLIAESTGKSGKGCIPIPTTDSETGADRFNVSVEPSSATDLAREFIRWEMATAICGHVLEIDPFNEPNVTESKENTKKVLANLPLPDESEHVIEAAEATTWLKNNVVTGDYVSIQAYVPYTQMESLKSLRIRVRDSLGGIAVTAGLGPRFLHSTGQLHKGGPNTCVAVQIVPAQPTGSAQIPGFDYDFNTLIRAQAEGDLQSLLSHGRRVVRIYVDNVDGVQ